MNFKKINNITGWTAFAIALATYVLTLEETGSYWDCGEFIAVSFKLMVPHPPGAPFFLMLGRMFSFLAMGDLTRVAYWINMLSALSSAFTLLFLFWSIVLFGRKMLGIHRDEDVTTEHTWSLMGAGLIGALAYTFSDSFWFSAVEAEVYAMSSFFTAFVVWAILKWDTMEDESKANRWLILIFYMMGLSIGVHMLNLVTIPALALIYYFKKYKPTTTGILITLLSAGFLVVLISEIIVPGLPGVAGSFELFFVNNLGMFFGSGALVFLLIIIALLVAGIRYSHLNNKPILNTFLISTAFILIGYGSYATVIIRSNYNTPINENAPKDVMSFVRYLKREQYGSRPLVTGPYFTSQLIDFKEGGFTWKKGAEKYEPAEKKMEYVYDEEHLLPRMWSSDYGDSYRRIMNLREGEKPTFSENIAYLFKHQIGTMYGRYFMWNFAGRESDEPGANWLRPAQWSEQLPKVLAENRGRNNFFMIPFFLGLLGMYFQAVKDVKNFSVVALLFVMLGVAIVVYLNSPPDEPRERDYIYAGSYYAFCFWIGFAVIGLADLLKPLLKNHRLAASVATLLCLSAPVVMAKDGWDDHDRSDRYFSVDSAKNYLESCAPNAILFTGGDNDTFPLWYAQDVENVRTDVRVLVLSYYNTDWYIEQSMQKYYTSEAVPYTLSLNDYRQGGPNDYLRYQNLKVESLDLKEFLEILKSGKLEVEGGNILPTKILTLDIDREAVLASGMIPKGMEDLVVDQMQFRVKGNALEKKDLAILDLIASSDWTRPVYLNYTSLAQVKFDISPYIVMEGNAFRILPVKNPTTGTDLVDTETAFNNMVKKYSYRGLDSSKPYYTNDYKGFVQNHRSSFNDLVAALIDEGKMDKAREAMMFSLEKMPDRGVRFDHLTIGIGNSQGTIELLFRLGEKEKAVEMAKLVGDRAIEITRYYTLSNDPFNDNNRRNMYVLSELQNVLYKYGEDELGKKYETAYDDILKILEANSPPDRSEF
ncbi:MAG: DUF2723 domain-containing protein [Bacteroidota bacterium]